VFAFHGYLWLIHRLTYRRTNHKQAIRDKLLEHKQYIAKYGEDMSEITAW
jgi:xylulose-5-phosphate/fructose-6-phosphate phosphoketolase